MIQPAPVLPSNGSPLLNADNGRSSRVLQEQSNNRQHNDYSYVDSTEQKYSSLLLAENNYPAHQQPQPQHVYRQTPLQRNQYRHSSGHYHLGHDVQDARMRAERQARILYQRFRASDQYMKYRNRQQKDDKNGQEQKWPDRLELAFFQALVFWPPMGRRQLPHKNKRRGRNELIADYIEELTGESRSRKQVSSHIQVLRPFVENDPYIMKYLSKYDMGTPAHHMRTYGGRAASYHHEGGRRASCYPGTGPVNGLPAPVAPMAPASSQELAKVKGVLAVFEPTDFQMFVQRKFEDESIDRLHDYTRAISNPRQDDEKPDDMASFSQAHPFAASLLSQRQPDCNIILAEASLAFPTVEFKDAETGKTLKGIELGISFPCKSRYLDINSDVVCRNTFYNHGELVAKHSGSAKVQLTRLDDSSGVETQLKFGSLFWAEQLGYLATRLRKKDDPERVIGEVRDYIKNITAYQEIFIITDQGPERLLIICWSFRLSRDIRGKAHWKRLRLPQTTSTNNDLPTPLRTDRVDSVYDYTLDFPTTLAQVQPSLQSPFEYDNSSSGAGSALPSALPSATWPANLDDNTATYSAIDFPATADDANAFDFAGGAINISYTTDPSLMDFSNFDSSAFNFDTGADSANFITDPSLQTYTDTQDSFHHDPSQTYDSQQGTADYATHWCDSYAAFDSHQQQSMSAAAGASNNYSTVGESQSQAFDGYTGHYEHAYSEGPSDGQAFGGAGQDVVHGREEDPLGALADASYLRVNLPTTSGHEEGEH